MTVQAQGAFVFVGKLTGTGALGRPLGASVGAVTLSKVSKYGNVEIVAVGTQGGTATTSV